MLSYYEQETIISFDRSSDDLTIYTADSTMMRKLDKMSANYRVIKEDTHDGITVSKTYRCNDKGLLTIRAGRVRRDMSPEARQAAGEHLSKARAAASKALSDKAL